MTTVNSLRSRLPDGLNIDHQPRFSKYSYHFDRDVKEWTSRERGPIRILASIIVAATIALKHVANLFIQLANYIYSLGHKPEPRVFSKPKVAEPPLSPKLNDHPPLQVPTLDPNSFSSQFLESKAEPRKLESSVSKVMQRRNERLRPRLSNISLKPLDLFCGIKPKAPKKAQTSRVESVSNPYPQLTEMVLDYLRGHQEIDSIQIDKNNYKEVLHAIKFADSYLLKQKEIVPRTTYELRTRCIEASNGKMSTLEAYTKSADPKYFVAGFSEVARKYAENPTNWIPERVALQARTLVKNVIESFSLSTKVNIQKSPPTLILLRGAPGSGKTHKVKNLSIFKGIGMKGSLSPDNFKADMRKGAPVNNVQSHTEGATLYAKTKKELELLTPKSMMVIDEVLGYPDQIEDWIAVAKETGRKIVLTDFDVPIALSAIRVLTRDPKVDPCVPSSLLMTYGPVLRKYRMDIISIAVQSHEVEKYELYVTDSTGKSALVAQKRFVEGKGVLDILDDELYEFAFPNEKDTLKEIEELKKATIEDLAKAYKGLFDENRLPRDRTQKVVDAIDKKAREVPDWKIVGPEPVA